MLDPTGPDASRTEPQQAQQAVRGHSGRAWNGVNGRVNQTTGNLPDSVVVSQRGAVTLVRRFPAKTRGHHLVKITSLHGSATTAVEIIILLSIAATAIIVLSGQAVAAEVPMYEVSGFPTTPHQASVVGSAHVQEWSPTPTITLKGMPASPHQIAVLTLHPRMTGQLAKRPDRKE